MQDYMRDHWRAEYNFTLVPKNMHGQVLHPEEQSFLRYHIDPVDLRNSPDYTFIYVVDVEPDSCECIVEYDDNRRKNRTWHLPIKNNKMTETEKLNLDYYRGRFATKKSKIIFNWQKF